MTAGGASQEVTSAFVRHISVSDCSMILHRFPTKVERLRGWSNSAIGRWLGNGLVGQVVARPSANSYRFLRTRLRRYCGIMDDGGWPNRHLAVSGSLVPTDS